MDYSVLDIYSKDKFILRSEARNMQFPFIRYSGGNYDELKEFITSESPNTKIPAPERLKIGELYTYSGSSFRLNPVPLRNLRYVIASNPYLVLSEGEYISLSLDYQQAVDYLEKNRHHKVFAYKDILSTYRYNPERASFLMVNRSHPNGITLKSLPHYDEWYIGGNDGANRMWVSLDVKYKDSLHIVSAQPTFEGIVDIIDELKYKINKSLHVQRRPIMFNVAWEDYDRRKTLKRNCNNVHDFRSFINTLFNVVSEETKGETHHSKETLGKFANQSIVCIIEQLKHYYGHDSHEVMNSTWPFSVDQIFEMYLEHNLGPQGPDDYSKLQEGILIDFHDFLGKIHESIREKMIISGTICLDEFGHLFCGKALIDQRFNRYKGLECVIKDYTNNVDENASQYPFFCERLDRVCVQIDGIIQRDEEGTFHLGRYRLKDIELDQMGKAVQLRSIRPYIDSRSPYLGEVIDFVPSDEIAAEPVLEVFTPMKDQFHFEIPEDIFEDAKKVADDTMYLHTLKDGIVKREQNIECFQKLFDYVLKWGKIEDNAEQKAMLTLLTGYNFPDASRTVRWCCDDYLPRVLYYIVKYISEDRFKYGLLERVDFYTTYETKIYAVNKDLTSLREVKNTSNTINKGIPPSVKRALNTLYPSLFPTEK